MGLHCYQCANYQKLVFNEAKEDLDKICNGPNTIPAKFVLIVGGKVSANMRTRIAAHAKKKGIHSTEVGAGLNLKNDIEGTRLLSLGGSVMAFPSLKVFQTFQHLFWKRWRVR